MAKKKQIIQDDDSMVKVNGKALIVISNTDKQFETYVAPGSDGQKVVQAIASTIYSLSEREKKIDAGFTSAELIRMIEVWLRILEDKQ